MKRSEINKIINNASYFFNKNGWALPPNPKWDVTDFGLNDFSLQGLVLINLAEEKEYCEKLMYSVKNQITPCHKHLKKKEDIICRTGQLILKIWKNDPAKNNNIDIINVKINGIWKSINSGSEISLDSGERATIEPGIWHEFYSKSEECIIGEVSTANDDNTDNIFSNNEIGRFSKIQEDEPIVIKLLNERWS